MASYSLRQYLSLRGSCGPQPVRSFCADHLRTKPISLRRLMSSMRIIHISDLHFTDSSNTFDWGVNGPTIDTQNSQQKSDAISHFLIANQSRFGPKIVIITGDLTDSGDDGDYTIARNFIGTLAASGFAVYSVPGNHDYCVEGNLVLADILSAIFSIPFLPTLDLPGLESAVRDTLSALGLKDIANDGFVSGIVGLLQRRKGVLSNNARRQNFRKWITGNVGYPRVLPFGAATIILLDSMQGELDDVPADLFAEGRLGSDQWAKFQQLVNDHQTERSDGKKLIVALHHSPFKSLSDDFTKGLNGAADFQNLVSKHVDCLLFGHTTPDGMWQQGGQDATGFNQQQTDQSIPLINCENLEPMAPSYPITVIDMGASLRVVFYADTQREPELSWGAPSGLE